MCAPTNQPTSNNHQQNQIHASLIFYQKLLQMEIGTILIISIWILFLKDNQFMASFNIKIYLYLFFLFPIIFVFFYIYRKKGKFFFLHCRWSHQSANFIFCLCYLECATLLSTNMKVRVESIQGSVWSLSSKLYSNK